MSKYLEFRNARCKDCYKCLRECPVKAIDFKGHQAEIIEDRCILCGHCTLACPQNAKIVHSELEEVKQMLAGTDKVIASVAPSFISSFGLTDFGVMKLALAKLGFADAEETAVGAQAVTKEYARLLKTGEFTNFITSACPAACRMIQEYYPKALKYLAPVDSPMVAHAKIIKKQHPDARIVFIGPCIAKKREADECHLIDHVLTFEDVVALFDDLRGCGGTLRREEHQTRRNYQPQPQQEKRHAQPCQRISDTARHYKLLPCAARRLRIHRRRRPEEVRRGFGKY